jgi:hypothetical protein
MSNRASLQHTPAQEAARLRRLKSVSYSELATLARCPRQHYWTYRHGGNGIERVKEFSAPRLLGTFGHIALAALYAGQSPNDLRLRMEEHIVRVLEGGSIFEEQEAELDDVVETVLDVIGRYRAQYPIEEFKVLAVEREFNLRLPGTGRRLTGFWDALVQDARGDVWIMDHKWVGHQFRQEYELELDLQLGIYEWAALESGLPLAGTIYNQLKAERPEPPRVLKDGKLSQDKSQKTTWRLYREALEVRGLDPRNYGEMQIALAERQWFDRHYLRRTHDQIRRFGAQVLARTRTLRQRNRIPDYMTPSRMTCQSCSFRELCLEEVRGRDPEPLIESMFQPRTKGQPISFAMLNGEGSAD